MTKDTLLMAVGAFVAVLPFLGFPHAWDTAFLVLLGAATIALGISVRRSCAKAVSKRERTRTTSKSEDGARGEPVLPPRVSEQSAPSTSTSGSDESGGYAGA